MEFDWADSTYELKLTQRPSGTHFSQSSTTDGESPLARDDGDNSLRTHAVLFSATPVAVGIFVAGLVVGAVVAVKAAPHVKRGLGNLRSKLRRREDESAAVEESAAVPVEPEQSDPPRLRAV
ncbi:hypothetical protein ACIQF6_31555 [Kitasatospora sp. NPDC092948]|uniref:hypothetical protein n=1 Tax=Kitasatospora sp. NPDC092948 TaxID=3364088 RepID=UPI0038282D9A